MALFTEKNAEKQLNAESGKVHRADLETCWSASGPLRKK